jgi:hypothetical protein
MQMTNYKAYLKESLLDTRSSKKEMKFRAITRSGDPKKIVDAIS